MNRKKILKYSLFILTAVSASFFWWSLGKAINFYGPSAWWQPLAFFSLFFVCFSLSAIFLRRNSVLTLLSVVVLASSFIFSFSFWHSVSVILAVIFMVMAQSRIKADLLYAVKINIWKSLRTGSTLLVFALSLAIASFYYSSVRNFPAEKLVPKFGASGITSQIVSKLVNYIFPKMQAANGDFTVDELILANQKGQPEALDIMNKLQSPQDISTIDKAILDEKMKEISQGNQRLILEQSRKQLGDIAGVELKGDEKVSDVFSALINQKINEVVVPKLSEKNILPIVPIVMALILFLTVFPIASFLSPLWLGIVYLIFIILVKIKVVNIVKIPAEIEMIE
jgi:hypothetical protein